MPKRRRRRATRPSEAGSHSAETSGSTDKVAPVEEDKGEVKDRHSSDKKSEKSDYDTTDAVEETAADTCLLYTSPSPRDGLLSRMPSSA